MEPTDPSTEPEEKLVNLYLIEALKAEGISHIFLVPGGMIEPFMPNYTVAGVEAVVAMHEAGAAYMADGYARARRSFAVCMGIGGPGVTNMVTAIAAAHADRSPVLVLSGSVPFIWEGLAPFQDSSQTGVPDKAIMEAVTVSNLKVPEAVSSGHFLQMSIRAMMGTENRPAILEVPYYMQEEKVRLTYKPVRPTLPRIVDQDGVQALPKILADAGRILLMAGNGVLHSDASEALEPFAKRYSIPVTTTLRAKGAVSEESDVSLGVFGMGGSLQATAAVFGQKATDGTPAIRKPDVIVLLGGNLNENNSYMSDDLQPLQALVRVDIDANVLEQDKYDSIAITADIRTLFDWLGENADQYDEALMKSKADREAWLSDIRQVPWFADEEGRNSKDTPLNPAAVVAELRRVAPRNTALVVDSGANTYFTGHNWTSYGPNDFFLLSTTGPMGYGVAMAIGVKKARPDQPVLAIMGDGDMGMHGMEFASAVRYGIPVVIVILDNHALGNVYLNVEKYGENAMELAEIPRHDWVQFAKAMGGDGIYVEHYDDLEPAFEKAFQSNIPFLVDVAVNKKTKTPNTGEPDIPGPVTCCTLNRR